MDKANTCPYCQRACDEPARSVSEYPPTVIVMSDQYTDGARCYTGKWADDPGIMGCGDTPEAAYSDTVEAIRAAHKAENKTFIWPSPSWTQGDN